MTQPSLYHCAAFASHPDGGNPAGVWIGETLPDPDTMQQIAQDVGFSETSFVAPFSGTDRTVRYYSPEAEVDFCGHATIAAGVILGRNEGEGTYRLATKVGEVPVAVRCREGTWEASLTSVDPKHKTPSASLIADALSALHWDQTGLDETIPPVCAYGGAWHLVLAVERHDRLARLDYDFESLKEIMLRNDLTTLQLVWKETPTLYHSRNPFPVGGVVEDPATGAAAAAFGGYLRDAGLLVSTPKRIVIKQGQEVGRPSRIVVDIPSAGGIVVTGAAVSMKPSD